MDKIELDEKDVPRDGMVLVPRELTIKQKVPGVRAYCRVAGECRPVALAEAWTAICDALTTPPAAPAALDVAITDDMVRRAASEYLMHKGERPWRVLRGGQELWETCAPAMRAALATLKARETV